MSGTSQATPVIAGLAALLIQVNPSLAQDPNKIRQIIEETASVVIAGSGGGRAAAIYFAIQRAQADQ